MLRGALTASPWAARMASCKHSTDQSGTRQSAVDRRHVFFRGLQTGGLWDRPQMREVTQTDRRTEKQEMTSMSRHCNANLSRPHWQMARKPRLTDSTPFCIDIESIDRIVQIAKVAQSNSRLSSRVDPAVCLSYEADCGYACNRAYGIRGAILGLRDCARTDIGGRQPSKNHRRRLTAILDGGTLVRCPCTRINLEVACNKLRVVA